MNTISLDDKQHNSDYQNPRISVIMPVHNVQEFIEDAITSILNQSYRSFELIILDDLSSDSTLQIAESFVDVRIKVIRSGERLGLSGQLNKGLSLARGEFIARMDGDDWSHPDRFEEQLRFLNDHSKVGICGTYYRTINSNGRWLDRVKTYPTNGILKYRSFFRNPFCHPSVMFRRSLIDAIGFYLTKNAEDYDLWIRAYDHTDFYILPKILLHYRIHNNSFSIVEKSSQEITAKNLRKKHISRLVNGMINSQNLEILIDAELDTSCITIDEAIKAHSIFLQRFQETITLSKEDVFFINQECAALYFKWYLYSKNGIAFSRFSSFYFSLPFFDKIAIAYIESAYFFYFKNKTSYAWLYLLLSTIKSPFNVANPMLCLLLIRKMIGRFKF